MNIVNNDLPPELQQEQAMLAQRQAIAQALFQRSGQTQMPQSKGRFAARMHPLQAVAQVVQGAQAGGLMRENMDQQKALGGKIENFMQEGVRDYIAKRASHVPEVPAPADDLGGGPSRPQMGADPRQTMIEAMVSRNPRLRAIGGMDYAADLKSREGYTLNQGDRRFQGGNEVASNPLQPKHQIPDGWEKNLPAGAVRDPKDPAGVFRMKGGDGQLDVYTMEFELGVPKGYKKLDNTPVTKVTNNNPAPVTTAVVIDPKDPSRQLVVDARTYKGGSLGSPGVVGVSGKEGDAQKREGKRQFNMQGLGKTLQQAEDLLLGIKRGPDGQALNEKGKLPTGSGVGTAVDYLGSLIGKSPDGAAEAQSLKAVAGALTSKMPRMEGPQSDRDTLLYKQMAAEVGDSTLPREQRIAALDKVKDLWLTYERLNQDVFENRRAPGNDGLPSAADVDAELARRRR